ncbi:MAG: sigma-70 family RNA polymerase sigma factor [Acidobacteria bacterium]|nr:sigma-70 family RNA polymerase sigma factor [Acidobacteriota bacterium]
MSQDGVLELLQEWQGGSHDAYDRLIPLVYGELHRVARGHLQREAQGHSLQPTLLVHEAYLRLAGAQVDWRTRTHFVSVAATVMRRILVEHARTRRTQKRGGADQRVTLTDGIAGETARSVDLLCLDEALERLKAIDARQAEALDLCYFGGLTHAEIGAALGVSDATVDRDLRHGRAWLRRQLSQS